MNAPQLLAQLEARGVRVEVEGDEVRMRGPARILTPALIDQAREHKAALRSLLQPVEAAPSVPEVEAAPNFLSALDRARAALPPGVPEAEVEELFQAITQADQEEAAWRAAGARRRFPDEISTEELFRQAHDPAAELGQ